MLYSTIVEKDEQGLLMILRAAEKFDEQRFLEGIHQRCYTSEDIQQAIDQVRAYQARLNTEARALVYFSQTFLQQYATDNNKCFETAHTLFNRIRSTISASRKVFKKTCPIIRKQQPREAERPSVFLRSVLARGECPQDMFGLLSYEESVQTLYAELQAFFTTIITTLGLCRYMIRTEQAIREDGDRCAQIYRDCERKVIGGVRELTKFLSATKVMPESELAERKAKARSMKDFYKENYHKWDTGQFRMSVAIEVLSKGHNDGLTDLEAMLWPNDHAKALRAREVVARFDELDHVEGQKGKLNSGTLVSFLKWCGVDADKEKKLYEEYFCKEYRGRYQTLRWNGVSQERKNRKEMGVSDESMAEDFERSVAALTDDDDAGRLMKMPAGGF